MTKTMKTLLLAAPLLLATTTFAQTQLVRGDIDGIQGTNQFQLDCTQIPLTSTTVNLQQLHNLSQQNNIEFEMQVVNVGTPAQPVLNVVSANQIPEMFDMGNLRFGRSETWEVFGVPGSAAFVFMTWRPLTSYLPVGPAGTWVLGGTVLTMGQGTISPIGQFRFNFTMPTIQSLVGFEFTSQAAVVEPTGNLVLTNPDCKEVRDN